RNDERHRLLPFDVVINWHDRSLRDIWMLLQHAFDVGRKNVFAAADEHIVRPAGKIMKAILVAAKYIAAAVKPVFRDWRLHVWPIMIAKHDRRRFHFQLAVIGRAGIA